MVSMSGERVVVYDLDGVITRKDSFSGLVVERLRQAPHRLLEAMPAAGAMLLGEHTRHRHRSARRVAEIALSGLCESEYLALATSFGHHIGGRPSWMRSSAVRRIRRQHAKGARIVIATASERHLAQALLTRAEVPYDLLSASMLAETSTGMTVADHRVGARKTESLREQGIVIEEAEFVTDSLTDLPTARAAASVVLIGASSRTRERFARAGVSTALAT
jgi:phosphatidylglycerophosphatase C